MTARSTLQAFLADDLNPEGQRFVMIDFDTDRDDRAVVVTVEEASSLIYQLTGLVHQFHRDEAGL